MSPFASLIECWLVLKPCSNAIPLIERTFNGNIGEANGGHLLALGKTGLFLNLLLRQPRIGSDTRVIGSLAGSIKLLEQLAAAARGAHMEVPCSIA